MCAQVTLFSNETAGPRGLRYQPDFISADEEKDLLGRIRELALAPFQFGAYEGKRRVASFGWSYDYTQQKLEQADDLPAWIAHSLQGSRPSQACNRQPSGKCSVRNMTRVSVSGGTATNRIFT